MRLKEHDHTMQEKIKLRAGPFKVRIPDWSVIFFSKKKKFQMLQVQWTCSWDFMKGATCPPPPGDNLR